MTKFHKSRKWGSSKYWCKTNLRKTYGSWIAFYFLAFKTKLINPFSFHVFISLKHTFELEYWNHDHQENWKPFNKNCTTQAIISQKNWSITNLRKTYGRWIAFYFLAFKIKLINFFSFHVFISLKHKFELEYWNHDHQENWRPFNKNCTTQATIFLKNLTCVSLSHKDFKKYLLMKLNF